jgi:ubiquitin
MSNTIQTEVANTHQYLNQSLSDFSDNLFETGASDQRFVITSVNNLANLLSRLLNSLMNASPSFGKGKSGSPEFSLPDIIKKQGDLIKEAENKQGGKKEGEKGDKSKSGNKGEESEQENSELYEVYKQQAFLKEMLSQLLKNKSSKSGNGNNPSKKMEELEQEMLHKGITKNAIQKMKEIKVELLKLEEALKEQGEDSKRNSKTGDQTLIQKTSKNINFKKEYFNNNEILNRQSLPLRTIYKKKVNEYFKTHN